MLEELVPFYHFILPGSFSQFQPHATCNESSEEQNGARRDQVAADDESGEDECVDEAALVVDRATVEGLPEAQVMTKVLR